MTEYQLLILILVLVVAQLILQISWTFRAVRCLKIQAQLNGYYTAHVLESEMDKKKQQKPEKFRQFYNN